MDTWLDRRHQRIAGAYTFLGIWPYCVNIWYLTAVSAWYVIVPKIIGGHRWNDLLTRMVVIPLVIMNITGGFHHQIIDPGISESIKYMHVFMSLAIGFPSLMTAYAMFRVFERTARAKGGKGLVGWYKKMHGAMYASSLRLSPW